MILSSSSGWKTTILVWLLRNTMIPIHSFSLKSLLCVKCLNSSSQYSASMNPSSVFFHSMFSSVSLLSQLGPNIKELFRLVEDFVDVIGLRMKEFQDMYEVTDNLGQPCLHQGDLYNYLCLSKQMFLSLLFFLGTLIFRTTMTGHKREPRGGWPDGETDISSAFNIRFTSSKTNNAVGLVIHTQGFIHSADSSHMAYNRIMSTQQSHQLNIFSLVLDLAQNRHWSEGFAICSPMTALLVINTVIRVIRH